MATPQLSKQLAQQAVDAVEQCGGNISAAARALGIPIPTMEKRFVIGRDRYGLKAKAARTVKPLEPLHPQPLDEAKLRTALLRKESTLRELAQALGVTEGAVLDGVRALQSDGANVFQRGESYSIEKTPIPVERDEDDLHGFESDDAGCYRFGFVTDNHLCSKYAREDVLGDLYDLFAAEGITRVYNAGNWIDGEARFNKFDLHTHGMTAQVAYFVDKYPQRPGITTYYVAGDDHEGWYAKDTGVDIGRYTELAARKAGREDLRYLGYMESFIALRHKHTRATSRMMVVHPGGGSSYAISYAPQKFIESLQGGEKPAVALFGHWHKMECLNYRGVWILQGGTTEDQTPFMRKLKLEAHVGGMLVELRQDDKGAIIDCIPRMRRYFDRGYYNDQYSPSGPLGKKEAA